MKVRSNNLINFNSDIRGIIGSLLYSLVLVAKCTKKYSFIPMPNSIREELRHNQSVRFTAEEFFKIFASSFNVHEFSAQIHQQMNRTSVKLAN